MGREDPQLKLRLTEEMKDAVTSAARENGRSVNAEIVARLTASFSGDFVTSDDLGSIKSQFAELLDYAKNLSTELVSAKKSEAHLLDNLENVTGLLSQSVQSNEKLLQMVIHDKKAVDK